MDISTSAETGKVRAYSSPTFIAYHKSVLRQMWGGVWADAKDIRESRSIAVLLIVAIGGTILLSKCGLVRSDQTVIAGIINSLPIVVSLLLYFVIHGLRAPWQLDQKRVEQIKAERERANQIERVSNARVAYLSWKAETWENVSVIKSRADVIKQLSARLGMFATIAKTPTGTDFANVFAAPLSGEWQPEAGPVNAEIEKWRFKQDFMDVRDTLNQYTVAREMYNCSVPNGKSIDEVNTLMDLTTTALNNYAASLLEPPTSATIS